MLSRVIIRISSTKTLTSLTIFFCTLHSLSNKKFLGNRLNCRFFSCHLKVVYLDKVSWRRVVNLVTFLSTELFVKSEARTASLPLNVPSFIKNHSNFFFGLIGPKTHQGRSMDKLERSCLRRISSNKPATVFFWQIV